MFLTRYLRRHLSGLAYFNLRYALPRRLAGLAGPRGPTVRSFCASGKIAAQLERVDLHRTTPLCRVLAAFGSDKSTGHTYTPVYDALLAGRRGENLRIFEMGLGTTDLSIPANMGREGRPGASLRAWQSFFPGAMVFGADIDSRVLFFDERIRTYHCDQTNGESIARLWNRADLAQVFDLMIDDGLHEFEANRSFLEGSISKLAPRGVYIVEDVKRTELPSWAGFFLRWERSHQHCACIAELPGTREHPEDNNLIVIQRLPL